MPFTLQIKDPLHGYIDLTNLEQKIVDLRMMQRIRNIRYPAGAHYVYPGVETSLMGRALGILHVTRIFIEYLGGSLEEVEKARLASILLLAQYGPFSNVMSEYLTTRGFDRKTVATILLDHSELSDIINDSEYSMSEVSDLVEKGTPIKGIRVDLTTTPINPEHVDNLERDSYFAGVEYAQLEFRRLFSSTRIAKNKMAFDRNALFTLDSYLSASLNMFDALYYHKTVRATELMLLRILDEIGSELIPLPSEKLDDYLIYDDLTLHDTLMHIEPDASDSMKNANRLFMDYRKRILIKRVSERSIGDKSFLDKLRTPDGLFNLESEIAEDAGIDPSNVYIDYPNRHSVSYYPGKHSLDDLVLFERGSRGYEFWRIEELSGIARSFGRDLKSIRVYTTRGYRSRLKKYADALLESVDGLGET